MAAGGWAGPKGCRAAGGRARVIHGGIATDCGSGVVRRENTPVRAGRPSGSPDRNVGKREAEQGMKLRKPPAKLDERPGGEGANSGRSTRNGK